MDYESLQRFRRRMLTTQMGATWIDLDDLSLLRRLGGYRKDRETGQEGLTLAGLLMFGRSESLHELRPYYRVDYFEYDNSTDISDRWIDRISNDGTWSGNLFDFFFRVYPKLQQGIKRPFRLNDDMTRQEETPADIALREALANAIIHADYYESFGIRIDNRPNGLFFTNPGSLLIPRARLPDGSIHPGICRNKSLQLMFQTLGIGDQAVIPPWSTRTSRLSFPSIPPSFPNACRVWLRRACSVFKVTGGVQHTYPQSCPTPSRRMKWLTSRKRLMSNLKRALCPTSTPNVRPQLSLIQPQMALCPTFGSLMSNLKRALYPTSAPNVRPQLSLIQPQMALCPTSAQPILRK